MSENSKIIFENLFSKKTLIKINLYILQCVNFPNHETNKRDKNIRVEGSDANLRPFN